MTTATTDERNDVCVVCQRMLPTWVEWQGKRITDDGFWWFNPTAVRWALICGQCVDTPEPQLFYPRDHTPTQVRALLTEWLPEAEENLRWQDLERDTANRGDDWQKSFGACLREVAYQTCRYVLETLQAALQALPAEQW